MNTTSATNGVGRKGALAMIALLATALPLIAQIDCNNQQASVNALSPLAYSWLVSRAKLPAGVNNLTAQQVQDAVIVDTAFVIGFICDYQTMQDKLAALQAVQPQPPTPTGQINLPTPTVYAADDCGDMNILSTTPFTTGSNAKGYALNSCSVYFSTVPANSTFSWGLYQRGANGPTSLVANSTASVAVTIPNAWATNSNTPANTVLQPNTTYDVTFGKSPYGLCARENYGGASTGYYASGFTGTYPNPFPAAQANVLWSEYCTVTPVQ